jgi:hypothetical protein
LAEPKSGTGVWFGDKLAKFTLHRPLRKRKGVIRPTDLPISRLSELFNINHFIVSQVCYGCARRHWQVGKPPYVTIAPLPQVNPHLVPFLNSRLSRSRSTLVHRLAMAAVREAFHGVQQLTAIGWLPASLGWLRDEVNAQVEGHVTIVPRLEWSSFMRALSNPSADSLKWCIQQVAREKCVGVHVCVLLTDCFGHVCDYYRPNKVPSAAWRLCGSGAGSTARSTLRWPQPGRVLLSPTTRRPSRPQPTSRWARSSHRPRRKAHL